MQRYVSKELTHFVGKNKRDIKDETQRKEEQYKIVNENLCANHCQNPI